MKRVFSSHTVFESGRWLVRFALYMSLIFHIHKYFIVSSYQSRVSSLSINKYIPFIVQAFISLKCSSLVGPIFSIASRFENSLKIALGCSVNCARVAVVHFGKSASLWLACFVVGRMRVFRVLPSVEAIQNAHFWYKQTTKGMPVSGQIMYRHVAEEIKEEIRLTHVSRRPTNLAHNLVCRTSCYLHRSSHNSVCGFSAAGFGPSNHVVAISNTIVFALIIIALLRWNWLAGRRYGRNLKTPIGILAHDHDNNGNNDVEMCRHKYTRNTRCSFAYECGFCAISNMDNDNYYLQCLSVTGRLLVSSYVCRLVDVVQIQRIQRWCRRRIKRLRRLLLLLHQQRRLRTSRPSSVLERGRVARIAYTAHSTFFGGESRRDFAHFPRVVSSVSMPVPPVCIYL